MDIIREGIEKGHISFDEEQKSILYTTISYRCRYTDPEEPVRARSYLSLIINYGYKPERIGVEINVPQYK